MLDGLPNTFEELNRVQCFNHTLQLSAKGLLKPFYSAGLMETDHETEYGDDDMPALRAMDEEEGDSDVDHDAGHDDEEEEEDPLGALDDDEREELINNTEAVSMTLNKVCSLFLLLFTFALHAHVHCYYRFGNSPSPLSIRPP
jgi:hypothetical protein